MPTQRTICGRPFFIYTLPRRFQVALGVIILLVTAIVLIPSSAVDVPAVAAVTDRLPEALKHPKLTSITERINPFTSAAHKPPIQANSSSGNARWYSDWRWRNPFSDSVTLDENRAVLPPLKRRPPIYTFYEPSKEAKTDKAVAAAEGRIIFRWRRAWWAQGMKPVVLGRAEAINNPLYKGVQMLKLADNIEEELYEWLAWGNMGTGILSSWLVFPMAAYNNHLLSFLRQGDYPQLTRYEGLKNSFFCGNKQAINEAIKTAISNPEQLRKSLSLADPTFNQLFQVDTVSDGLAFYSRETIRKNYELISKSLDDHDQPVNIAKGYRLLGELINAHLQTTWQAIFDKGVAVVKPLPKHMTILVEPSLEIAGNLTECPINPIPTACPPNQPKCKRCVSSQPLQITTPPTYRNKTGLFNIGSVPHPFTTMALTHERDVIDPKFIRSVGFQERDSWVKALTQDLLGQGVGSAVRAVGVKEAVAGDYGSWQSLWLTAERAYHEDLDWIFGFDIPRNGTWAGTSETPVPGPERRPPPPQSEGPAISKEQLSLDRNRLMKTREQIGSTVRHQIIIRDAVEAWNLVDAEVWRFVRAFSARRKMERRKWEQEEAGYAGAEGRSRGAWWRWLDILR